ncbi:MAG: hypothetical protein RLY86_977 [Pseudomonadota bacterium]|jgi:hypothetical protein
MKTFDALRTPSTHRGPAGEELVPAGDDLFQIRQAERGVMVRPDGTYNFVRVVGETRNAARTLVSAKAGHAAIAGGHPVLFAGTARFSNGTLDWWSNYSGTYQPNAAFRSQAGLPDERFTPWQQLQMGGIGLQRGTFLDRRAATSPQQPEPPTKAEKPGAGKAGADTRAAGKVTTARGAKPAAATAPTTVPTHTTPTVGPTPGPTAPSRSAGRSPGSPAAPAPAAPAPRWAGVSFPSADPSPTQPAPTQPAPTRTQAPRPAPAAATARPSAGPASPVGTSAPFTALSPANAPAPPVQAKQAAAGGVPRTGAPFRPAIGARR